MNNLKIKVIENLSLDAGVVEETNENFIIHPPAQSMMEQLIEYLDAKPYQYKDIQVQRLGVGFSALCVRWGSYLATLMDVSTDLHPVIPGFHKRQPAYSLTAQSEMKRLNIEISANIYRLVQIFRQRGDSGLWELLSKAYDYLPMPHKRMPKNRESTNAILMAIAQGSLVAMHRRELDNRQVAIDRIAITHSDRFLANALTLHAWRNTLIEDIHFGASPPQPLSPYQRRFTKNTQLALMREVTSNLGSILFLMEPLFNENYHYRNFLSWPQTALAIANTSYGRGAFDWSVADWTCAVTLHK